MNSPVIVTGSDLQGGAPVTITGEFMGTLAYASPEQTKGDPNLIDIRTDVYSLGVILYEMLTGKYPYPVVGQMAEVLRNIAEAEPKKPSTIRRQINDEVETIVLKALAKEKERRYQSAETLARDVGHYLAGEPIDAKRDSTWYVIRKSLRRYRLAVAVAAAFVLLMTAGVIVSTTLYYRAKAAGDAEADQRRIAVAAEREQSHARQEAEAAREAEEAQRKLAEQREAEIQKRADELRTVTEFLSSVLSDIDMAEMGCGIGLLRSQGMLAEAEPLYRQALEMQRGTLGDEHPYTLASMGALVLLLRAQGELVEAEVLARRLLAIRRKTLPHDDTDVAGSLIFLGSVLTDSGKPREAEPMLRESLNILREGLHEGHWLTADSQSVLGGCLLALGRHEEAKPLLIQGYAQLNAEFGAAHELTQEAIQRLVDLYDDWGKPEQAARWRTKVPSTQPASQPPIGQARYLVIGPVDHKTCSVGPLRIEITPIDTAKLGKDHPFRWRGPKTAGFLLFDVKITNTDDQRDLLCQVGHLDFPGVILPEPTRGHFLEGRTTTLKIQEELELIGQGDSRLTAVAHEKATILMEDGNRYQILSYRDFSERYYYLMRKEMRRARGLAFIPYVGGFIASSQMQDAAERRPERLMQAQQMVMRPGVVPVGSLVRGILAFIWPPDIQPGILILRLPVQPGQTAYFNFDVVRID
jgi:hypothetical protein